MSGNGFKHFAGEVKYGEYWVHSVKLHALLLAKSPGDGGWPADAFDSGWIANPFGASRKQAMRGFGGPVACH